MLLFEFSNSLEMLFHMEYVAYRITVAGATRARCLLLVPSR